MKTINFSNYQTITKKCVSMNYENKAIVHNKEVYNLKEITNNSALNGFYILPHFYDDNELNYCELFNDYDFITACVEKIYNHMSLENLINAITKYPYKGYNGFKNMMKEKLDKQLFVTVQDIKIAQLAGETQEYINSLIQARENYYKIKEQQENMERQEKKKEEQKEIQEKQNKLDELIKITEQKIINKQQVFNIDIEVPMESGDAETTLILYLLKKYDIKVPIKTQGWINKALHSLKQIDDKYSYDYYSKNTANSTVFGDYLDQLIQAIKTAYNVEISAQEEEQKAQIQEQKQYTESIPALNFKELKGNREEFELNKFKRETTKHELTNDEVIELLKRIYKHVKCDFIETKIENSMMLRKLNSEQKKYSESVYYGNGNMIKAEAFEVNGEVIIIYHKKTKKDYYYKEVLIVEQNTSDIAC